MLRIKTNNILIAVGLVFFYTGISSTAPEIKQAFSSSAEKRLQQEAEVEAVFSVPLNSQPGETQPMVVFAPDSGGSDSLAEVSPLELAEPPLAASAWFSDDSLDEDIVEQQAPVALDIEPEVPVRLSIPAIALEAPVIPAESSVVTVAGKEYQQWQAPNTFAAGWHGTSAKLGEPGNTVLNGHHNIYGEVFVRLVDLNVGDMILVYSTQHEYQYIITNKMILPEKYQELDVRLNNAQWIMPSQDERLTLITCWPYESNTHRLIIVAQPILREKLDQKHE